jgi:hypothetical protein
MIDSFFNRTFVKKFIHFNRSQKRIIEGLKCNYLKTAKTNYRLKITRVNNCA